MGEDDDSQSEEEGGDFAIHLTPPYFEMSHGRRLAGGNDVIGQCAKLLLNGTECF